MIYFLISLLFISCQDFNSNSFDQTQAESLEFDTSTQAGVRLKKGYYIIKDKCMGCHTGYHNDWTRFNTDELWEENSLIISGDAQASELIIRLKNVGGDMPLGSSQIDEQDYDALNDWIDNI